MGRRKLYIPITRSGSSILASIFTQLIREAARQERAEIDQRVAKGEMSPIWGEIRKHPWASWFLFWSLVLVCFLIYALIMQLLGYPLK